MSSPCLVKTVKTTLMTNRDQDGCSNSIQIQGTIIGFAEKKPICSLGDEIQLKDQHLVVERVRPAWCTAIERRQCTSHDFDCRVIPLFVVPSLRRRMPDHWLIANLATHRVHRRRRW